MHVGAKIIVNTPIPAYPLGLVAPEVDPGSALEAGYRVEVWPLFDVEIQSGWHRLDKATIDQWIASEPFQTLCNFFADYPGHSLLSSVGRAFLYQLVRANRPGDVVEIGTYWGGTAEVIARALHANNFGHLYTCDPYGAERCPAVMAQWAPALRKRVTFLPANSMALADYLKMREIRLDLAFIDGCHDFEYALFDVIACAHIMRPGGIVVLDNAEHPGVYSAFREFMRANPDWSSLSTFDAKAAFADPFSQTLERSSVKDTTFIVLEAPRFTSLSPGAYTSTGQVGFSGHVLSGLRITALPGGAGQLHYEACLRGFGEGMPIEVKAIGTRRIARRRGPLVIDVPSEAKLASSAQYSAASAYRCTSEITLYWAPDDGASTLKLTELPIAHGPGPAELSGA